MDANKGAAKPIRARGAQVFVVGALVAACLMPHPARADYYIMEFAQTYNAPMSNFINHTFLNQTVLNNAIGRGTRQAPRQRVSLAPPQPEKSAAELAQVAPAAQRDKLGKVFVQLLPAYQQIEHKLGWPKEDLAGAIAALLAGNYMVLTGSELSDAPVAAAGNQLRNSQPVQELIGRLSANDRRRLYEQCAMLGTFMALANKTAAQQSQPVLVNLRNSARENLKLVLGENADRLRFTDSGMRFE